LDKQTFDLNKVIEENFGKIVRELREGKDIIIKLTPKGIKVQTLQTSTIR
jgi:hypothetical protein